MATSGLVSKITTFRQALGFVRRHLSATAAASAAPSSPTSIGEKNPKTRRKKKNLFEVAQFLPNWGLGYHMAKNHWTGVSYQITKINLYKDGRHGKAWGIAHKDGTPAADAPKKISGVHKRCWRYLPNLTNLSVKEPPSTKPLETPQSQGVTS
ncbi:hypothetical protein MLD38_033168 [Melastoma candidum]|uniref:Uncharacterized protein n=1 Tax=Melastoma candidum TaxID=119954 RepID=A0ACB9M607_9MYRT|nr:hypothetical protein MLD38_033168 [Melastoma candidum]